MVSRKKILLVVIVVVAVVAVVGIYLMQSLGTSFTEAENTMKSFITALNNYDLDASWNLMSSDLQEFYETKEDFNSSVLSGLKEANWQALLTTVNSRSIETSGGVTTARFVVVLQITEGGMGAHGETYTFKLTKVGDQWKIIGWQAGVWD